jgi:hypothetical protein
MTNSQGVLTNIYTYIYSSHTQSYFSFLQFIIFSYDFTFIDNEPYFIEINCFGKENAAGSALFHWIIDYDKLYGVNDCIYVRTTIE